MSFKRQPLILRLRRFRLLTKHGTETLHYPLFPGIPNSLPIDEPNVNRVRLSTLSVNKENTRKIRLSLLKMIISSIVRSPSTLPKSFWTTFIDSQFFTISLLSPMVCLPINCRTFRKVISSTRSVYKFSKCLNHPNFSQNLS